MKRILTHLLNFFLIIFFLDGVLSSIYLIPKVFNLFEFSIIYKFSAFLSFLVMALSIIIYLLMIFIPAIPKKLFLSEILYVFVVSLLLYPVTIMGGGIDKAELIFSIGEIIIGLGCLLYLKRKTGNIILEGLTGRLFSIKNLLYTSLFSIIITIPLLISLLTFDIITYVEHESNGFIDVTWDSIRSIRKTYVKDGDTSEVELVGMMHIGDTDFYDNMLDTFDFKDSHETIILSEGVSDKNHLVSKKFNYKKVAKSFGLVSQENHYFDPKKYNMIRADVDTSEFSKSTIGMLNSVAKILNGESMPFSEQEKLMKFSTSLQKDIIYKRNEHLIKVFDSVNGKYKKIIVPWGALHMPEFEKYLIGIGFKLEKTYHYSVVKF